MVSKSNKTSLSVKGLLKGREEHLTGQAWALWEWKKDGERQGSSKG